MSFDSAKGRAKDVIRRIEQAASEAVDDAVSAGRFTQEQGALMTRESQEYVLKFKALELWDELKHGIR